jgi:hypothetical protein
MKITHDLAEIVAKKHDRSSCSDSNPCNGEYIIVENYIQGVEVSREFQQAPRCLRCFFLSNIDTWDDRLELVCTLSLIQPKFKIEQI